jgi:hypothetical protein
VTVPRDQGAVSPFRSDLVAVIVEDAEVPTSRSVLGTGFTSILRAVGLVGWALAMAALAVISMLRGEWALAVGGSVSVGMAALMLIKRPGNRVAITLLALGTVLVTTDLVWTMIESPMTGIMWLDRAVAVLGSSIFVLVGTLGCTLLLIYPTGAAPGHWRWALWAVLAIGIVGAGTGAVWGAIQPVDDALALLRAGENTANPAEFAAALTFGLFFPTALAALFVRYRRAQTVERLQIRWLVLAAFLLLATSAIQNILGDFESPIGKILVAVAFVGFPVAIGLAVLRYRLYEIDRIVSRTVSYGAVITMLVAVYFLAVTLLTRVLPIQGDLPVAASTLLAAALFNPLRRRTQTVVDRRFNRTRYDADRELAALAYRLRDTTDLGAIESDVQALLDRTLEPSVTGVWLGERAPADPPLVRPSHETTRTI